MPALLIQAAWRTLFKIATSRDHCPLVKKIFQLSYFFRPVAAVVVETLVLILTHIMSASASVNNLATFYSRLKLVSMYGVPRAEHLSQPTVQCQWHATYKSE